MNDLVASDSDDDGDLKLLDSIKPHHASIEGANRVYHYCSSETLHTILSKKTIRLSDISKMNDSMEMDWGLEILEQALSENKNIIGSDHFDLLKEKIGEAKRRTRFLISCFSKEKDILSQWRSYASDGSGFSIGFDPKKLKKVKPGFGAVTYDTGEQLSTFRDKLLTSNNLWRQSKKNMDDQFSLRIVIQLLAHSCFMKNPAFSEEKEFRFVHGILYDHGPDGFSIGIPKIMDKKLKVEFCIRSGQISPFIDVPFPKDLNFVEEIVLGPKNTNFEIDVRALLHANNHDDVEISRSLASYR